MTGRAMLFMAASWAFVLGLTAWSFTKVLRHRRHDDPDDIGPAPPVEPPVHRR